MQRVIIPIVIALIIIICCVIYLNVDTSINSGTDNISYNNIIYERTDAFPYNLKFHEKNPKYIGDFSQIYAYGQEKLWEVYIMDGDDNVLHTSHATWVKPGYVIPDEFGEEFSSVDYVVSDGFDFLFMPDNYSEVVTSLATFNDSVKLEDIVETEASDITEFTTHDSIRLTYKNFPNMSLNLDLCSYDGEYYLNVQRYENEVVINELYKIKPEYVDLLTSAISK